MIAVLVAGWLLAILVAGAGFYQQHGALPSISDVLVSVTLLAPFALPKACADTLGLTATNSTAGVLPATLCFWSLVGALLLSIRRWQSLWPVILLLLLVLLASFRWFIVGAGMFGL